MKVLTIDIPIEKTSPLSSQPLERHNPKTLGNIKALRELQDSIESYGQLVPILVIKNRSNYKIVDGHRRVAALRELGRKTVMAIQVENGHAFELFSELNGTDRPLRGREWTDAVLAGGTLPKGIQQRYWDELTEWVDTKTIRRVHKKYPFALSIVIEVHRISDYANLPFDTCFEWLAQQGNRVKVRTAIKNKIITSTVLANAIKKNKPVKLKLVGEY